MNIPERLPKPKYAHKIFAHMMPSSLCEDVELVPTSAWPHMKFKWSHLNPMQSQVFPLLDKDRHLVLCSPTASGKTAVMEMVASWANANGGKAIYISPLRALSAEKLQDWTDPSHDFGSKKIAILTGDQGKTEAKIQEINEADIALLTSEMANSCLRFAKESHTWIKDTKALIIDEVHLLGTSGSRGACLEVMIMQFTEINPTVRIFVASATCPNVQELADWLTKITGKPTDLFISKYRPCSLEYLYYVFQTSSRSSWKVEQEIRQEI